MTGWLSDLAKASPVYDHLDVTSGGALSVQVFADILNGRGGLSAADVVDPHHACMFLIMIGCSCIFSSFYNIMHRPGSNPLVLCSP